MRMSLDWYTNWDKNHGTKRPFNPGNSQLPRQSYRLQEITTTYENTISIIAHVKTVKEGVAYL